MKLKKSNEKALFSFLFFIIFFAVGFSQNETSPVETVVQFIDEDRDSTQTTAQADSQQNLASQYFIAPSYNQTSGIFTVESTPNPKKGQANGYVSDPGDIITANEEQIINQMLWELEKKSTAQIAVVMLPSIGDEVPKSFAVDLFEEWGIGQKETDNGLLILTIMDQRRTEFEVGYGLEPILTDAVCLRIGTDEIVPFFKQGRFGSGIVSALTRINQFLDDPEVIDEIYAHNIGTSNHSSGRILWEGVLLVYLIFCGFIGGVFFLMVLLTDSAKEDYKDKYDRIKMYRFGCMSYFMPFPFILINRYINKRLHVYRYGPRFSKLNNKPLTLLSNYDEIDFLKEGQLIEEEIESKDYDVWVTDDKSDVLILDYKGSKRNRYINCYECNYKTARKIRSKVIKRATYSKSGTREDTYECKNCNYTYKKKRTIPKKTYSSSSSSSGSSSSWSSSSSSSSSSSFGGGSSGGGGSGVSW